MKAPSENTSKYTSYTLKILYYLFPLLSVIAAFRKSWTCDDAFISFRYALNLARGTGLVFNQGEYVEGMTNFLWTVLLSPFLFMGLDAEKTADALGILFFILLFCAVIFAGPLLLGEKKIFSWRKGFSGAGLSHLPWISVLSLSLHHHMQVFATSGLETSFFVFLITAGALFFAVFSERLSGRADTVALSAVRFGFFRPAAGAHAFLPGFLSFLFFSLAALARPDGLLFYGTASLFSLYFIFNALRKLDPSSGTAGVFGRSLYENLIVQMSFVFIFIPVWIFRYLYYGSLLPNTFYAKSAYDPYFSQGWTYISLYFSSYYVFAVLSALLAAILILLKIRRRFSLKLYFFDRVSVFFAALILLWILYVLQVGGDFMFARFLVPVTPLLYLFFDRSFYRIGAGKTVYAAAAVISAAFTFFRYDPFRSEPYPLIGSVTEEYRVYTPERRKVYKEFSLYFREVLNQSDPVLAFKGGNAAMVYYLDVSTAIEAETGLTDSFIARKKIKERGRIGHEKSAPLSYLMKRKVSLVLGTLPSDRDFGYNTLVVKGFPGKIEILTWQPGVMAILLANPDLEITNFPDYLDGLVKRNQKISGDEFREFENYYFQFVSDEKRLNLIKKQVK